MDEECSECQVPPAALPTLDRKRGEARYRDAGGRRGRFHGAQGHVHDGLLEVSVENGFDPDSPSPRRHGLGLRNVRSRLETRFGGAWCRLVTNANFENIAGSNYLGGNIDIFPGGSSVYFESEAGTLTFGGNLQCQGALANPRTIIFEGSGNILVSGQILAATNVAAPTSILKLGAGTLILSANNTFDGSTIVSNGELLVNGSIGTNTVAVQTGAILGGSGTIGGNVTFAVGALALCTNGAPLTISGPLTLNNNTVQLNLPSNLGAGTYTLATYAESGSSGAFNATPVINNGSLLAGATATVTTASGVVSLVVSAPCTVIYNGNGNSSGTAPVDPNSPYTSGSTVTVLGAGSLTKTGYSFAGWNTAANGSGTPYAPGATFAITSNTTLYEQWTINTYTLTYTAGTNGKISGTTPQTVNCGASGSPVTAVANTGYHFVNWSDGVATASRTDTNVTYSISVTANFVINTYTLTYAAGTNGTVTGATNQTVNYGASGSPVTAVPNTGYHFINWSDGLSANPRTDINVTGSISVTANFVLSTVANFAAAPTNGYAPLAVTFTNLSTGLGLTNWLWSFGDGTTLTYLTGTNTIHTYTSAGNYTVSLVVSGQSGVGSITVTNAIQVMQCMVFFRTQPIASQVAVPGGTVTLLASATTSTTQTNYQWYFQGNQIAGATNSTLILSGLQATNFGTYFVEVSNGNCSENSGNAVLTLANSPMLTPLGIYGTTLTLSVPTQYGPNCSYIVEYKNDLNDATWTTLNTLTGDGNSHIVTDNIANSPCRFYRIRLQ